MPYKGLKLIAPSVRLPADKYETAAPQNGFI
jgi:hypothetical protein